MGIKDAGIAICHSRGYIISIPRAPKKGWSEWTPVGHRVASEEDTYKKKLSLNKKHFSVIESHVRSIMQDEKNALNLLELMMKPTDPAEE